MHKELKEQRASEDNLFANKEQKQEEKEKEQKITSNNTTEETLHNRSLVCRINAFHCSICIQGYLTVKYVITAFCFYCKKPIFL